MEQRIFTVFRSVGALARICVKECVCGEGVGYNGPFRQKLLCEKMKVNGNISEKCWGYTPTPGVSPYAFVPYRVPPRCLITVEYTLRSEGAGAILE